MCRNPTSGSVPTIPSQPRSASFRLVFGGGGGDGGVYCYCCTISCYLGCLTRPHACSPLVLPLYPPLVFSFLFLIPFLSSDLEINCTWTICPDRGTLAKCGVCGGSWTRSFMRYPGFPLFSFLFFLLELSIISPSVACFLFHFYGVSWVMVRSSWVFVICAKIGVGEQGVQREGGTWHFGWDHGNIYLHLQPDNPSTRNRIMSRQGRT